MVASRSVIIIGAGIAGLSSAAQLAYHGAKVSIFAPNGIGDGASGARTGILCPALGMRLSKPLGRFGGECLKRYPEWLKELGLNISIEPRVSVRLCSSLPRRKNFDLPENSHIDQQWLSAKELWKRYPYLKKRDGHIVGGVVSSCIATLSTAKLLAELKNFVLNNGGFFVDQPVNDIRDESSKIKVIVSCGQEYSADYAVIAAGAGSQELISKVAEPLEAPLPAISLHPGGMIGANIPDLFHEIIHYDQQTLVCRDGMLWITGGTLSQTSYAAFLYERLQSIIDWPSSTIAHWSGTRVRAQGGLPVVRQLNQSSRIMVNFAHGGNGFLFAPIASKMVADLVYQGA